MRTRTAIGKYLIIGIDNVKEMDKFTKIIKWINNTVSNLIVPDTSETVEDEVLIDMSCDDNRILHKNKSEFSFKHSSVQHNRSSFYDCKPYNYDLHDE